jgi:pimeloyl-ACP methyl ester carboxylesterase
MTPEAIEITVVPDVVLRGQLWPGDELTIVLVHEPGDGHDLDRWRPLVPYLLGADATVAALDLRGHGASDGDWDPAQSASDLAAIVAAIRRTGSRYVVLCAAGESAIPAIRAAELTPVDGLVLLSPAGSDESLPRGAGEPKLLIRAGNSEKGQAVDRLRPGLIGPALFVTVPGNRHGTELLTSESALTVREHILAFLREVRSSALAKSAPDRFLESLGIRAKGMGT